MTGNQAPVVWKPIGQGAWSAPSFLDGPNSSGAQAYAINTAGRVVGNDGAHAVFWDPTPAGGWARTWPSYS